MTSLVLRGHVSEVEFDEASHRYTRKGVVLPSVTRILREQGMTPFGTSGPSVVTTKMQIGTWLHDMLRLHFLGRLDEESISHAMREVLEAVKGWARTIALVPVSVEVPMAHSLYWYAGKPDLVAWVRDRELVVIDWKWGVPKGADVLQLAGYVEMVRDCYGLEPGRIAAIPAYLKDIVTGRVVRTIAGKDLAGATGTFLSAVSCHRWRIANGLLPAAGVEYEEEDQPE